MERDSGFSAFYGGLDTTDDQTRARLLGEKVEKRLKIPDLPSLVKSRLGRGRVGSLWKRNTREVEKYVLKSTARKSKAGKRKESELDIKEILGEEGEISVDENDENEDLRERDGVLEDKRGTVIGIKRSLHNDVIQKRRVDVQEKEEYDDNDNDNVMIRASFLSKENIRPQSNF